MGSVGNAGTIITQSSENFIRDMITSSMSNSDIQSAVEAYSLEQRQNDDAIMNVINVGKVVNDLNFGDNVSTTIGDWDVEIWSEEVAYSSSNRQQGMFIQLDNESSGEHIHRGDINSQDELDYYKNQIIQRLNNYNR